jgi:hypothetical protein
VLIGAQGSPKFPKGDDMSNQSEGSTRKIHTAAEKKEKSQRKDQNTLGGGRKVLLKRAKNATMTMAKSSVNYQTAKTRTINTFFVGGKDVIELEHVICFCRKKCLSSLVSCLVIAFNVFQVSILPKNN